MEFGLREWLIVIGVIVVVVILLDGWRRRGNNKKKFKLDEQGAGFDDESDHPRLGTASLNSDLEDEREEDPSFGDEGAAGESRDSLRDEDYADEEADADEDRAFEEVLVINVVARDPKGFKGPALLQSILESGLRFGDMDIFHRHESGSGKGEVLFSMANAIGKGTFDLDDIEHFSTRAVSFFLGLPGPSNPKQAFETMVVAARKLSSELNGELKDDQRSVLTGQSIEHYRNRIVEYERRRQSGRH